MISDNDAAIDLVKFFFKNIGLGGSYTHISATAPGSDLTQSFAVVFKLPTSIHYSSRETMDGFISELRDKVRKSEEVTRMIMDVQRENERLIAENSRLTLEIEELTPLRNHYEVEMKLRHGEVLIGLDGVQVKSGLR